ncbi:MAG TPA: TIGR03013 family XrtA/PEP-CTERM system glycosyltransferase [Vicinamibacterales bacterium]|nr:TIGR03013 family XrtA/PEP-CTERM system glycosyltransferase [Vicinamibacterales bacterium]
MTRVLLQRLTWRWSTLVGCESLIIVGALMTALRLQLGGAESTGASTLSKVMLVALICQACLYCRDLYDIKQLRNKGELIARVLQALGAMAVVLALVYVLLPPLIIAPGVASLAAVLALVAITSWRVVFTWVARLVPPGERLLVVGTSAAAVGLAREMQASWDGINIVGFVDSDGRDASASEVPIIGTIEDVPAIVRARAVDRVVVSLADARGKLPMDKLLEMKLDGVSFAHLASVYEEYMGRIAVENLRPSWLIFSEGFRKTRLLLALKRTCDVVFAGIAIVIALPLMAAVALAVKLTSPGPVVYRQRRVGLQGRVFTLRKFRSMTANAEANGAVWAASADPRVTPLGRILRKTHLDELPQLWNILKGDMSLVGPRPERPEFVTSLSRDIPFYGQRHIVRPGLTGWAQVCQAYASSVDDTMEKLQYDLFYIKNMSIGLDFYIAIRTIKIVLQGRGI